MVLNEQHLTAFLIGFSMMFSLHYLLEPTWGVGEARPRRWRWIFNYSLGTLAICLSYLYLHPDQWFDLLVSVSGAGLATMLAHSRDWLMNMLNRDQANGLIEERKEKP